MILPLRLALSLFAPPEEPPPPPPADPPPETDESAAEQPVEQPSEPAEEPAPPPPAPVDDEDKNGGDNNDDGDGDGEDDHEADTDAEPPSPGERFSDAFSRGQQGRVPNTWPFEQRCNMGADPKSVCFMIGGEIFTGFRYNNVSGSGFSEFALDRTEVLTGFLWKPFKRLETGFDVRLETVRSAGPGSLQGVDQNSIVVRVAQVFGQAVTHLGPIDLGVRAGMIPERWVEQVEKSYDIRGIGPLPSERNLFYDTADLGGGLTVSGWKGRAELDIQYVNGEGRRQQEQNSGKNTMVMLAVRPINRRIKTAKTEGPLVLSLFGAYRDGSLGVAVARNHRASGAITFRSPWAVAGFEYAHAFGLDGRGDITANTLGAWASGWAFHPYVGLLAKYERTAQDLSDAESTVQLISAGAFSDLFPYVDRNRRRIRLHLVYEYEGYGAAAGPLPGTPNAVNTHRVMLMVQVRGLLRLWNIAAAHE